MKFDGWQESKGCNICNDKPIHDWIRFRKGEPIPEDMKFDGWQESKGS